MKNYSLLDRSDDEVPTLDLDLYGDLGSLDLGSFDLHQDDIDILRQIPSSREQQEGGIDNFLPPNFNATNLGSDGVGFNFPDIFDWVSKF